jgi:8-oxo-dGTP pyrophosphatase MutT (NUDIX family)
VSDPAFGVYDDSRQALRSDAFALLRAAEAGPVRDAFEGHLASYEDGLWRDGPPEHFTASAVVFSADGNHVLLVLHKKAKLWLQPGGHFEQGDRTVAGAALREATEESGIAGLAIEPEPIDLDVHPVTCSLGVPTRHLDVRYLAHAPAGAVEVRSDESVDLRWWPLAELPDDVAFGRALAG